MTSSSAHLATVKEPLWFCLKAQPKREHLAAARLRHEFNLTCFSPRLRFRKLTKRGTIWFVEAMFPGYLFARFVYAELHRGVIHASGVQSIVRFGEQVATLDSATVLALQEMSQNDEIITVDPELRVGEAVKIAEGPMAGLEALVTRIIPAKERVRVLLEFLGRSVEMEVAAPAVLSVESARAAFLTRPHSESGLRHGAGSQGHISC